MYRLRRVTPPVVVLLVIYLSLMPVVFAQEPAGPGAPAGTAAVSTTPQTSTQNGVTLKAGWWKIPSAMGTAYYGGESHVFQSQAPAPSGKKWTRGGKIMTGIGLGVLGAGIVMIAHGSSSDEIGDSGLAINWRATGAIWAGVGGVLTLVGLTRRR